MSRVTFAERSIVLIHESLKNLRILRREICVFEEHLRRVSHRSHRDFGILHRLFEELLLRLFHRLSKTRLDILRLLLKFLTRDEV